MVKPDKQHRTPFCLTPCALTRFFVMWHKYQCRSSSTLKLDYISSSLQTPAVLFLPHQGAFHSKNPALDKNLSHIMQLKRLSWACLNHKHHFAAEGTHGSKMLWLTFCRDLEQAQHSFSSWATFWGFNNVEPQFFVYIDSQFRNTDVLICRRCLFRNPEQDTHCERPLVGWSCRGWGNLAVANNLKCCHG